MEFVQMSEAAKLIRSIRDRHNPATASEALKLRDKWLLENDLGVLDMAPNVRALLEDALASPDRDS